MREPARSPHWPALRRRFLKGRVCALCGSKKNLEAHHIRPFHLFRKLELDERNLIALCEGVDQCHRLWGHFGNWKLFNPSVRADVAAYAKKRAAAERRERR